MSKNASRTAGRHFLQIPGPTPVPDRVLRAARDGASPLFVAHFAMCAATAAVCVVAVALYHVRASGDEAAQSIAGWGEIAAQASDLEQGL